MADTIKLKRSAVQGKKPLTTDVELGEIAINTYDGRLFLKKDDGFEAIVEIGGDIDGGDAGPLPPPAFTGSILDILVSTGTPMDPVDVSSNFNSGTIPDTYSLQNAPTWMSIDNLGVISGTADVEAVTSNVTVTASNAYGDTVSNPFTVTSQPPPVAGYDYSLLVGWNNGFLYGYRPTSHPTSSFGLITPSDYYSNKLIYQLTGNPGNGNVTLNLGVNGDESITDVNAIYIDVENSPSGIVELLWSIDNNRYETVNTELSNYLKNHYDTTPDVYLGFSLSATPTVLITANKSTTAASDIQIQGTATINGSTYTTGTYSISGDTVIIKNNGTLGADLTGFRFIEDVYTSVDVQDYGQITTLNIDGAWNTGAFSYLKAMTSFTTNTKVFSKVSDFSYAWDACSGLTSFPLIDTSSVTNFGATWRDCSGLTSFPAIDTSNATTLSSAWYNCSSLTSFPAIDTSNATILSSAWFGCSSLTSFPTIDTSSGTDFGWTWFGCSSLTSFPQIDTSSGTKFFSTWKNCTGLSSFPAIDTSSGTDFRSTWQDCTNLVCLSSVNTLNATDTSSMFLNCTSLTAPDATDQAAIEAGADWINPGSCP